MEHQPVNPNASDSARELLEKLYALRGKTILSAQHDYIGSGTRYNDQVAELVGRSPSIFGGDFSFTYCGEKPEAIHHCGPANLTEPGHGIDQWEYRPEKVFAPESPPQFLDVDLRDSRQALVERCIALHRAGRLITLMWHCPTPDKGDVSGNADLWSHGAFAEEKWQEVLTPGTKLHRQWEEQVDRMAVYLKQLQQADVPVLWRPYHEMNGGWFWWGNRSDFSRLWRQLYVRLTEVHDLNNLLWVWNPNAPRDTPGDEAGAYADCYPGGDVVDVLATDVYHNDYRDSHYTDLLELADGKPIALGEVGHLPEPDLLKQRPLWSWVMPWGGLLFRFNSEERIRETYSAIS
ncbi:Mannan endo-1,4-beta-mannosidase [Pontiella desulfatans]|uniref:Mannan endo-1,4-beta-mannosidase n=1 Tax=Pontiella desulfatans TaxID=2750659 RepID=A0A6C2UB10_PONDE|nr:glycosyl hydrolase [Pontiella desulfatans]VGO17215.1 Mannan endo-1,4-beta-mannosidase [Pontiella desulfatans]